MYTGQLIRTKSWKMTKASHIRGGYSSCFLWAKPSTIGRALSVRSEYSMRISLSLASVGFDPGTFLRLSFVSPEFCLIYHFCGGPYVKTTLPISSKMDSFSNRKQKRGANLWNPPRDSYEGRPPIPKNGVHSNAQKVPRNVNNRPFNKLLVYTQTIRLINCVGGHKAWIPQHPKLNQRNRPNPGAGIFL